MRCPVCHSACGTTDLSAQRQLPPDDSARGMQLRHKLCAQTVVLALRTNGLPPRSGQQLYAFLCEVQCFQTIGSGVCTHETPRKQVNFQAITARPASRAPDLHQSRAVVAGRGRRWGLHGRGERSWGGWTPGMAMG